jgi:PKD repeat protein
MFVSGLSGSYTINTKGLFTYSVYVKDSDGIFQNISGTADVTGYPLSVTLLATPSAGISPLAVNISAFASGGVPSYSYSWSFGNGTTPVSSGSLSYINYTFNTPGIYNVSVTVTDSTHKTTVNSTYVYVYAPPPSGLSTIDITGIVGTIILVAFAMYWYIFIFRKKKRKGKFKSYLEGNETSPYEFPNYNTYNPPKKKNPFSKLGNLIHKKGKNNVVKEEQYNNPPPYNGYHGPQQYGQGYRQNVNNYPENNLEQNQYSEKTIPYLQENRENETRNPPVISLRKKRER